MIKMRGRRGLSPVIATVLLISIALVLAIIIFLWARSVVSEKIQKFDEPVENACDLARFDVEAVGGDKPQIHIVNRGSVALYGIEVRKKGAGSVETVSSFAEGGGKATITTGETESVGIDDLIRDGKIESGDEIIVVPVILGETSSFKKAFVCDVGFGIETTVKEI